MNEVAAYVDGTLPDVERRTLEAHLATCAECRTEVGDVGGIVHASTGARRSTAWIPALAAAAAIVIISLVPGAMRDPAPAVHRDASLTLTPAPRLIAPVGRVSSVNAVTWSAVPTADRYRVRLFDPAGTVLWERETVDTTALVPASVSLRRGSPYYWRVESHSGFDRWAASDLVEFVP